jgi:hypothetical protein
VLTITKCDGGTTEKECKKISDLNCNWEIGKKNTNYKCFGSEMCLDYNHLNNQNSCYR